jgi:hypothetical protein
VGWKFGRQIQAKPSMRDPTGETPRPPRQVPRYSSRELKPGHSPDSLSPLGTYPHRPAEFGEYGAAGKVG